MGALAQPDTQHWSSRPVVVTGGRGFLGTAVVALLEELGADVRAPSSSDFDLRDAPRARAALAGAETVFNLAARVGGIGFNARNPAPLLRDNLLICANVIEAARVNGVATLVTAGSVCAYPKHAAVPFREDEIWDGYPEETNAPYGIAKRVAMQLADAYHRQHGLNALSPVLANLYGPGDNFDLGDGHVIPALVRRFTEAARRGDERVDVWGTGAATREFLYVDDGARALLLAAERLSTPAPVNIGTGEETSIRDLAEAIRELTGFDGEIAWDPLQPDGQPRRTLDVTAARELIGFEAETGLRKGLARTVDWYCERRSG